jgi:hypothetical protein
MVSNVTASSQVQQAVASPQPPKPNPQPAAPSSSATQDAVQLSAAAQKAVSGDVDHDGDSH